MAPRRYRLYRVDAPDGRSYIGCTVQPVETRHAGRVGEALGIYGQHLSPDSLGYAIRKFGPDGFSVEDIASAVGVEHAALTEELLIVQHGTMWPDGYNLRAKSALAGRRTARPPKPPPIVRDWLLVSRKGTTEWPPHAGRTA